VNKKKEFKLPEKIGADPLEQLTGLSDMRHRQIAKQGFFPIPMDGKYQFAETIRGMFKYYQEMDQRRGAIKDVKLEREKEKLRAEKVAADRAEEIVVDRATGKQVVTRAFTALKFQVLTIPKKLSQRLALEADPVNVEAILTKEVRAPFENFQFDWGVMKCPTCEKPTK